MTEITSFDLINSFSTKKRIDDLANYDAYLTNKAMSLHVDTLFDAVKMNQCSNLDNDMQYEYYMTSVRKTKRYGKKWPKPIKDEAINAVSEYYKYSRDKAKDVIDILSDNDIKYITEQLRKGGTK